ncbi:SDR family NAD(P)-dependent oxidoreductase [Leptospira biflexa]|nr:SDR family NAD(P)-dependent oxidoreductase [Leptospira biflexa]TGM50642.1 SDR family NAD(P)-dependent oxidoreductase [Leptospira biflexa]TGM55916.1 SDR family NAD(P)-dependent oxidoreductase [Leptospira biflexa]
MMLLKGNTILITGGTSGIGLALAKRFSDLGNQILVCGTNEKKLEEISISYPSWATYRFDISLPEERVKLFQKTTEDFPELNVVFNNAGIQRYPKLSEVEPWTDLVKEIDVNLGAPIHLSMLFAKHLFAKKNAAILNTTSGLSHIPLAYAPIYSATKAALHSFTLTLRFQFRNQPIEVIEVSPPMVDTDLGIPNTHTAGLNLDEYADTVMIGLQNGELEITTGYSTITANASREQKNEIFLSMNLARSSSN